MLFLRREQALRLGVLADGGGHPADDEERLEMLEERFVSDGGERILECRGARVLKRDSCADGGEELGE